MTKCWKEYDPESQQEKYVEQTTDFVSQLRSKKRKLENDIKELLVQFKAETSLTITSIDIDIFRNATMADGWEFLISTVKTKTEEL